MAMHVALQCALFRLSTLEHHEDVQFMLLGSIVDSTWLPRTDRRMELSSDLSVKGTPRQQKQG